MRILVSAGEASGDMYAAGLVNHLREQLPDLELFGCAGPRMRAAGVKPVIAAEQLSVVGLVEVVAHLPRIYSLYRKLRGYARSHRPVAAILTDNPDFHLRLARDLKRAKVPVFYLVAPQVWAWRQGRVKMLRRLVDHLFCLFPFEQAWFQERGVRASYIGHPLATMVRPLTNRREFFAAHRLNEAAKTVVLLPGSRVGEAGRHLPVVLDAMRLLRRDLPAVQCLLAVPAGFNTQVALARFRERFDAESIQVIEGHTWDAIAHADLALAASGTVTVEAALLGTPMVTYYRVTELSWRLGRWLVKVPFLTMVNLVAQRAIVPELLQHELTADRLAGEARQLLTDPERVERMRRELAGVRALLAPTADPLRGAAAMIAATLTGEGGSTSGRRQSLDGVMA